MNKGLLSIVLVLLSSTVVLAENIAQHLQDISVTISSGSGSGSGVIITRDLLPTKTSDVKLKEKVNFVWTAAHVVDNLRHIRTTVDSKTGQEKKVIEYSPVFLVKELSENGRKVGETKMEAKVLKFSDSETGHDLALLMVLKKNFITNSAKFDLDDALPEIGTPLFHVGSLLGQDGSNSMTNGILAQVGRVLNLTGGNSVTFDQTTVTAFPGSSGGGVFLADGPNKGKYTGMLVRGAGETFNLIVPIRRMKKWAAENNLMWTLDETVEQPSLEEINKITVE